MLKRFKSRLNLDEPNTDKNRSRQDLDTADILRGFKYLSKQLRVDSPHRLLSPLNIVVYGDACSVLVLRKRARTPNVEFFARTADDMREILLAKRLISNDLRPIPTNWLSADQVSMLQDSSASDALYENSVRQNIVMYQSDVLRVYAVDYRFQLVVKIASAYERNRARLQEDVQFDNDMADAVALMRVLIERNKGRPLTSGEVRSWYAQGPKLTDDELSCAEAAYIAVFSEPAIISESRGIDDVSTEVLSDRSRTSNSS